MAAIHFDHQVPLKERASFLFVERAQVDVEDGAFVLMKADGERVQIPVGMLTSILLEPGARSSHSAAHLAARTVFTA